jgi:hypothetical protein
MVELYHMFGETQEVWCCPSRRVLLAADWPLATTTDNETWS